MRPFFRLCAVSTLLVLAGLMCTIHPVQAQVVIEQDDIPVEAGTVCPFFVQADPEGVEVDLGQAGGDQFWDLTGYIYGDVQFDLLVNPAEAPHGDTFPEANRVILSSGGLFSMGMGSVYQYEAVTDTGWHLLGVGLTVGDTFGIDLDFPISALNGIQLLPMPAEYGDDWAIADTFNHIMAAPDTLPLFDSLRIEVIIGGSSELDAWGTLCFPGGETEALRQYVTYSGVVNAYSITWFGPVRIELPLGEVLQINVTHNYRWFAPGMGEIASINSFPLEEDPDFDLAAGVRVTYIPPALAFQDTALSLGEVTVGQFGLAELTVENTGIGPGMILGMVLNPQLEDEIVVAGDFPFIIQPDSSLTINFIWTPKEEGQLETTVGLNHNDISITNPAQIMLEGIAVTNGVEELSGVVPAEYVLEQNRPNPFNPGTSIRFRLERPGFTSLVVHNSVGREVARLVEGFMPIGVHEAQFDADHLASGVYFYSLKINGYHEVRQMVLLK